MKKSLEGCLLDELKFHEVNVIFRYGMPFERDYFRGQNYYYLSCAKCGFTHLFWDPQMAVVPNPDIPDDLFKSNDPLFAVEITLDEKPGSSEFEFEKFKFENESSFKTGLVEKIDALVYKGFSDPDFDLKFGMYDIKKRAKEWYSTRMDESVFQDYLDGIRTKSGRLFCFRIRVQRVERFSFADGTLAEYGFDRSRYPDGDIWFLTLGAETFFVDKLCLTPEFLENTGPDPEKWRAFAYKIVTGFKPLDRIYIDPEQKPGEVPVVPRKYARVTGDSVLKNILKD